jgi:hypothetical protein
MNNPRADRRIDDPAMLPALIYGAIVVPHLNVDMSRRC